MKKNLFLCTLLLVLMASCNSNTYSDQRKAEDKLIANYISRNGLNIINEQPAGDVWGEKDYYKVAGYDNLYFHLNKRGPATTIEDGDTIDNTILSNETVVLRYKRFTLTENPDTTSYWSTLDNAYPTEFKYLTDASTNACTGWQEAVRLMKYPYSECVIICPSKQGFDSENSNVTPYCYIMNIKVKR